MKIKSLAIGTAVVSLLMANSIAGAVTYRNSGNHNFSGLMNAVVGGVSMQCNTTITVNSPQTNDAPPQTATFAHFAPNDNNHGHALSVTGMTLSGGPLNACALAQFVSGGPVTVSNGNMQMSSVVVNGPFGVTCSGAINVPITAQTHATATTPGSTTITFTGASLGTCTFSGALTSNTLDIDGSGRAGDPYRTAPDGHKR